MFESEPPFPTDRLVEALTLLALVAAGCGKSTGTAVSQTAETEGLYLDINGLKYQIEMSRYMNPADIEDREFLRGLPEDEAATTGEQTWFGVWVRVENVSEDEARESATEWAIHDTQENVYEPVEIDPEINVFAFQPGTEVPPKSVLPYPSTAAGQGPIQGLMLLFKIENDSFQNRPLELIFSNGEGSDEGTYDLDV
jgi:hypothetical protein